jgi:hypothetical protein
MQTAAEESNPATAAEPSSMMLHTMVHLLQPRSDAAAAAQQAAPVAWVDLRKIGNIARSASQSLELSTLFCTDLSLGSSQR